MNYKPALILTSIALILSADLTARELYKSVDEDGNVTYSYHPPAGSVTSEEIKVAPPPQESEVEAAKERAADIAKEADKTQAQREAIAKEREAQREAAVESAPEITEEIEEVEGEGYPAVYDNPPLRPMPPIARPPVGGGGGGDHPAYTPRAR